ncbi:hypothetical protein EGW08_017399 [Elysia chlorotica]|uniref:Uncharacterized protein n=1 Tax=Elysia chlorotica TaxID=188477 RepID=A0A433SZX7_ELYCH|nr:hypothetical protein EGW08_017399 [Elysia chlorotica]
MAARMNPRILAAKEKMLDDLVGEFKDRLDIFSTEVKTKMRSSSNEMATHMFEVVLLFLTQVFPDLSTLDSGSESTLSGFEKDLAETKQSLAETKQSLSETKQSLSETKQSLSETKQSLLETKQSLSETKQSLSETKKSLSETKQSHRFLSTKILKNEEKAILFKRQIKKLNKVSETNTHQIWGLRKLQKLLSNMTMTIQTAAAAAVAAAVPSAQATAATPQSAQATAATPQSAQATAATPSAQATAATPQSAQATAATPRGPPKSLRHESTFSAKTAGDSETPCIEDMKLLPGGLVLLSDW